MVEYYGYMKTIQTLHNRLEQIVQISYDLLVGKIVGGEIVVSNEASLQMQFGVILKQIGKLYEFCEDDKFSIELEIWREIGSTTKSKKGRARCDIWLELRNNDETWQAAIELKFFKQDKNEAVTDNRFSLLLDLENLEHYKVNSANLLCYEIVYTDNVNYTKIDNRSKIKITPTISGNIEPYCERTITLQKSYSSIWESYSPQHHFLKINLNV